MNIRLDCSFFLPFHCLGWPNFSRSPPSSSLELYVWPRNMWGTACNVFMGILGHSRISGTCVIKVDVLWSRTGRGKTRGAGKEGRASQSASLGAQNNLICDPQNKKANSGWCVWQQRCFLFKLMADSSIFWPIVARPSSLTAKETYASLIGRQGWRRRTTEMRKNNEYVILRW